MKRNGEQGVHSIDRYLKEVVRRIRRSFPNTRRIVLFGSHAYGRPHKDSDLDLFIEIPTRTRRRTRNRIEAMLDPRPCGIDLIVKTPQDTRQILHDFNPCFEDIVRKGRVLYAKTR